MDSPADELRELTKVLERIRLEVQGMASAMAQLESLFMWQRTCPKCGQFLERADPKQKTPCPCGWVWE